MSPDLFENLRLELRRGCLVLAVLSQLQTERYGYALRKALADLDMAIDENTLYPLLRRLETQGLLESQWREEDKRNKRFYRLSPDGQLILQKLLDEWRTMNASLDRVIGDKPPNQTNGAEVSGSQPLPSGSPTGPVHASPVPSPQLNEQI